METHRLTRAVLMAAALLLPGCADQNVRTDSFADMNEARDRGAIERGWVPGSLPPKAYELRAAYEPDGSRRWGILNFRAEDADALRAALMPDETSVAGMTIDIPPRIEWWPIALRRDLQADVIASTGLRTYRARDGNLVFAVNWNQGRAYYWTVSQR